MSGIRKYSVWLLLVPIAGVLAVAAGSRWCCSGISQELVSSRQEIADLDSRIDKLMEQIPRSSVCKKRVEALAREWEHFQVSTAIRLRQLGITAIPYIELETRSKEAARRHKALQMLTWIAEPAIPRLGQPASLSSAGRTKWRKKYIGPIMDRAMYDHEPDIRRLAVRNVSVLCPRSLARLDRLLDLLSDSDSGVRAEAARVVMCRYGREDLVPPDLQKAARETTIQ